MLFEPRKRSSIFEIAAEETKAMTKKKKSKDEICYSIDLKPIENGYNLTFWTDGGEDTVYLKDLSSLQPEIEKRIKA